MRHWSRQELEHGLRFCPGSVTLGAGNDAVVCAARKPDDDRRVTVVGGAYGNPVPGHLFVPVMLSYAQEPVVDVIENAALETVYGRPIKTEFYPGRFIAFELVRRRGVCSSPKT
jgi:methylamine--corrinoid protein Co-methyltransferase